MNKSFQPTATDIASYVQIVDKNRNGKVTRDELEEFIIRYFFNPNRTTWWLFICISLNNITGKYYSFGHQCFIQSQRYRNRGLGLENKATVVDLSFLDKNIIYGN
jgi:hypothetical protein